MDDGLHHIRQKGYLNDDIKKQKTEDSVIEDPQNREHKVDHVEGMLGVYLHRNEEDLEGIRQFVSVKLSLSTLKGKFIVLPEFLFLFFLSTCHMRKFEHFRAESITEGALNPGEPVLRLKLVLLHVLFMDFTMESHDIGRHHKEGEESLNYA